MYTIYKYIHYSVMCIYIIYRYVYTRARVSVHFVSANLCTIIVLLLVLWYSGYKGKRRLLALYNIITGRCRAAPVGPTLYSVLFFLLFYTRIIHTSLQHFLAHSQLSTFSSAVSTLLFYYYY